MTDEHELTVLLPHNILNLFCANSIIIYAAADERRERDRLVTVDYRAHCDHVTTGGNRFGTSCWLPTSVVSVVRNTFFFFQVFKTLPHPTQLYHSNLFIVEILLVLFCLFVYYIFSLFENGLFFKWLIVAF